MKYQQIHKLKELVTSHTKEFAQKDYGKKIDYERTKRDMLERITRIEEGRILEAKYLKDLEEKCAWLKKKHNVDFKAMLEAPEGTVEKGDDGLVPV